MVYSWQGVPVNNGENTNQPELKIRIWKIKIIFNMMEVKTRKKQKRTWKILFQDYQNQIVSSKKSRTPLTVDSVEKLWPNKGK